jgi:hypothetical protein
MSDTGLAEFPMLVGDAPTRNTFQERACRTALAVDALPTKAADAINLETVRAHIVRLLAAKAATSSPDIFTPEPARAPSPAAIRMRRSRKRRRDELRVIPFEIRADEINGLVMRGLLDPVARNDRDAVASALGRLFDAVPPERWPVPVAR